MASGTAFPSDRWFPISSKSLLRVIVTVVMIWALRELAFRRNNAGTDASPKSPIAK